MHPTALTPPWAAARPRAWLAVAIVCVLALVITVALTRPASASEMPSVDATATLEEGAAEVGLEDVLSDVVAGSTSDTLAEPVLEAVEEEGYAVDHAEVSDDGLEVEVSAGEDEQGITAQLELDDQGRGTWTFAAEIDGVRSVQEFGVEVETMTEDDIAVWLTDPSTGERQLFTDDDVVTSAAFVVPIFLGGVALATLLKAIVIGTAIVIAGILLYQATTATIDRIAEWNRQRASRDKRYHFQAVLQSGKVFIGNPLTRTSAINRARAGSDIWSTSSSHAKDVAAAVRGGPAVGPENHGRGKGYYWHYHPRGRTPSVHLFYGLASW